MYSSPIPLITAFDDLHRVVSLKLELRKVINPYPKLCVVKGLDFAFEEQLYKYPLKIFICASKRSASRVAVLV